jgi:hypothetical protein
MELENNRKLFLDHLSSILHGALVSGSLWPLKSSEWMSGKVTMKVPSKWVWIIKIMLFLVSYEDLEGKDINQQKGC